MQETIFTVRTFRRTFKANVRGAIQSVRVSGDSSSTRAIHAEKNPEWKNYFLDG